MPDGTDEQLMEVALVQPEEKISAKPIENPAPFGVISENKWKEMTQGVTLPALAGGLAGAFMVGVIPNVVKWNTGWKGVVASLGVTLVGGLVVGKMHKTVAYGWVIGGGIVTAVKALRMVVGDKPQLKFLGDEMGADLIYGDIGAEYDEFFGADAITEEDLFGLGDDPIIPTAGLDVDLY